MGKSCYLYQLAKIKSDAFSRKIAKHLSQYKTLCSALRCQELKGGRVEQKMRRHTEEANKTSFQLSTSLQVVIVVLIHKYEMWKSRYNIMAVP
jgi:hypothetical protein